VPPNITIMALPPKCPELNPVENVWQFLRENCKRCCQAAALSAADT